MRIKLAAALLALLPMIAFGQTSPVGRWKTIDDDTGQPTSIVVVSEQNGQLNGVIEQLLRKPDQDQNLRCALCKGDRKDKPLQGLNILWGVSKKGDGWGRGRILDPKSGKEYAVKLRLIDGGRKLEVRGYLGFSLLGRTQLWVRAD